MSKRIYKPSSTTSIPGFRTRPSEIGQLIGKDFSPAVFNSPEMMEADLAYYVGDKRTVIDVVPQLIKVLKDLPDGKILFFHCVKGSITKEELCNFFNEVCVDVPFKLTPNELYEIGTIPYSHGINKTTDSEDAVEHTYYGFELNKYEGDIKSVAKHNKTEDIIQTFENYKEDDEELQNNDVTLQVSKKSDLEKYFRRDKTMLNKLDDSSEYFVFFAYDDSMDENSITELYNNITDSGDLSSAGVTKLGTIRRKYPQSGNFENYSVFAIKA